MIYLCKVSNRLVEPPDYVFVLGANRPVQAVKQVEQQTGSRYVSLVAEIPETSKVYRVDAPPTWHREEEERDRAMSHDGLPLSPITPDEDVL